MLRHLSPVERQEINRKVDGWLAKLVGGVLLWIGLVFAGLTIWGIYKVSLLKQPENAAAYAIALGFAFIATFCLSVGWRLFLNRPNRYGSVLGPIGWSVLSFLFAAAGTFIIVVFGVPELLSDLSMTWPVAACFVFSYWCFRLARKAIANASRPAL